MKNQWRKICSLTCWGSYSTARQGSLSLWSLRLLYQGISPMPLIAPTRRIDTGWFLIFDICGTVTPAKGTCPRFTARCKQNRIDTVTGLRVLMESLHVQKFGVTVATTVILNSLRCFGLHLFKNLKDPIQNKKKRACVRYWTLKNILQPLASHVWFVLAV
jgi:hypothetical protein